MGLASVAGPSSFQKTLYGDLRPTGRSYRELFSPQRDSFCPDVDTMRRETLSPLNSSTHLGLRLKIPIKGSLEAYLQDPLITVRVIIFASWRTNLLVQSSSFLSPRPCRNVPEKVAPALSPGFIGSSKRLVKSPDFTLYRGFLFSIESVA